MPIIAAVQGGAVGGGVDVVAACDLRYCTQDAFFCIQEINIGLAADVGTLQRLPRLIPEGLMRELAYTGRRMYADEALAAGLVTRVFDDHAAMLQGVTAIAKEIAGNLMERYVAGEIDKISLVYNEFKSAIQAKAIVQPLLPIQRIEAPEGDPSPERTPREDTR